MAISELPLVDEHTTLVAAGAADAWAALLATVDGSFSGSGATAFARLVGCADPAASGPRPLAEGARIPGFRVASAVPGRDLVLVGRHRFSRYALTFHIEPLAAGSSRLRAESRAEFPGGAGRAYRLLVVGTGAHVLAVRRLLAGVRRRAEAAAR